jgi:HK97 family phage major capsid protein
VSTQHRGAPQPRTARPDSRDHPSALLISRYWANPNLSASVACRAGSFGDLGNRESCTTGTSVAVRRAGATVANLDPFIDGRFAAEAHNASLSVWLMHPDTAKALTKLKVLSSGSNQPLLQFVEDGIRVAGLPVLTSTHVDSGTVAWGIDKTQVRYVLRKGTTVDRFDSVTNDGLWIRAISRLGFGFLNPAGVVRLHHTP